jgi:hypothetical protein
MTTNGSDNPRLVLRDFVDRRVRIVGYLDDLGPHCNSRHKFLVARFQDVSVTLPNGFRHDIGHARAHHAETLANCPIGSRVSCSCTVRPYRHRPRDGETVGAADFGLDFPSAIEVVTKPIWLPTVTRDPTNGTHPNLTMLSPPPRPSPPPVNPLEAVKKIRDQVEKAGGVDAVTALLDAVERVNGWDAAAEVMDIADGVGGIAALKELLEMLKL